MNFIFVYSLILFVIGKEGIYQNILKKVNLPIVQHEVCKNKLRNTRLGIRYVLHESFICAGAEIGKDTCKVSKYYYN